MLLLNEEHLGTVRVRKIAFCLYVDLGSILVFDNEVGDVVLGLRVFEFLGLILNRRTIGYITEELLVDRILVFTLDLPLANLW